LRAYSAAFAILVIIIVAAATWLTERHALVWHWSSRESAALSKPSRRLLANMPGPIHIFAFVGGDRLLERHTAELIDRYRRYKSDITVSIVNPRARPDLVRRMGVKRIGELVVHYRGRTATASLPDESRLSGALERVQRNGNRLVAFLTGHGERNMDGQANFDLGSFGNALRRKGYKLVPVSLASTPAIPPAASLLVISSPQTDLLPGEKTIVSRYLKRGGNLLWLADPGDGKRLGFLERELGLRLRKGVVVDPKAGKLLSVADPTLILVNHYGDTPVTDGLDSPCVLVQAAALRTQAKDSGGWKMSPMFESPARDWLAPSVDAALVQSSPSAKEPKGPLLLGMVLTRGVAAAKGTTRRQRVAVVGDGDFLSNEYLGNGANLQIGLNLLDWLSADDTLINVRVRAAPDQTLDLDRTQILVMGFGFLAVLPALLLAIAGWFWWRLRRG